MVSLLWIFAVICGIAIDYALSHSCEMEKQALNALKSMKRFDKEIIASKWLSVIENI